MPPKITTLAFVSLGCPKNLVDSERMLGLLAEDGLTITGRMEDADAIVVNTCGFLEAAKQESLGVIRQVAAMKATGRCQRLIVAGCLVQRHKTKLLAEVPQIDTLVGVFDREHIVAAVRGSRRGAATGGHFLGKYHVIDEDGAKRKRSFDDDRARFRLTPRHWAYLRISEGCNHGCAFCTIPSIRGPMRSKPARRILAEARELAADGAVELNLIGQDTTSYGNDLADDTGLSGLLRTLDRELPDVHWLRLMYAYPSCFTDEMIRTIAECRRVVKYIDMPLQHINDQILTRMRRRVTRKQTETLLHKLRQWVPGITIRTTFIAGSPGETNQQHRELVQFVRDFEFDMLGVFPYSPEPGTAMGRMADHVPDEVKRQRVEELMLTQQKVAFAKAAARQGSIVEVLIDDQRKGGWTARTAGQAPEIDSVTILKAKDLHPGQFAQAKITGHREYDLLAEVAPAAPRSRKLTVLG